MTSTRVDRKYVLSEQLLNCALTENEGSWTLDAVGGLVVQRYETEYFDTPDLRLFHAGRGRRPLRSKVRVRHYVDTGHRFVEVKSRNVRGETTKVREGWTGSLTDANAMLDTAFGVAATQLVGELVPTARTAYERTALVLAGGGRMTIDRRLQVGPHPAVTHELFDEGASLVIVETKAPDSSPTTIDRWLWEHRNRPQSLSKYALAVASFRAELPFNRWTRSVNQLVPID